MEEKLEKIKRVFFNYKSEFIYSGSSCSSGFSASTSR